MSGAVCADRHRAVIRHCRALPMPPRRSKNRPRISQARLEEMVEEATVDCYNESGQVTGWFTMIEENLAIPFDTTVLGVPVIVPLPTPPPDGAEWIEACRRWLGEGS